MGRGKECPRTRLNESTFLRIDFTALMKRHTAKWLNIKKEAASFETASTMAGT